MAFKSRAVKLLIGLAVVFGIPTVVLTSFSLRSIWAWDWSRGVL